MQEKLLSVLMSTYKEPVEYVERTMRSLLDQTYRNLELVVLVDDPENQPVIDYLEQTAQQDKRLNVIINPHNMGLVKTLNRGLPCCMGEYIARMDAGDVCDLTRFEKQVAFMEEKNYDLVGAWFLCFDATQQWGKTVLPVTDQRIRRAIRWGNYFVHSAWVVRREVYEQLEGYRNVHVCEDYDFILRAALHGFRLGNCPEPLISLWLNPEGISLGNYSLQVTTADYIAAQYRAGRSPSQEEYEAYIQSEACQRYKQEVERMDSQLEAYGKASFVRKPWILLGLWRNPVYRNKRWNHYVYLLLCGGLNHM
jgi:glycosyltransferase involved in cell wall biosynthesis